jgi:predicted dehydrogenase
MTRTQIALVGCGGMGRRHLTGLAALARSSFATIDLVAVCDVNRQNAEDLADEAATQLGRRPQVFADLHAIIGSGPHVDGASVVTDPATHHTIVNACLAAGLHVLCEKPLALTMRGCNALIAAARSAGRVLSVAENYRRDPINRLARALIADGALGTPQLMMEIAIGGGSRMLITPWRHDKLKGSVTVELGVHNADILQYYLGPASVAYGATRLYEPVRHRPSDGGPGGFYAKWAAQMPEVVTATGEDALFGQLQFASGAVGQLILHYAGHGRALADRQVFGSAGSLATPGDRNGRPLTLYRDDGTAISDAQILDYAPSYRLDPLAAELFGGARPWRYDYPFTETDARIMALEYGEFAECIQRSTPPEVTGEVGRHAVAIVYALHESALLGRPVTLDEVERVTVDGYQREIDRHLGLL